MQLPVEHSFSFRVWIAISFLERFPADKNQTNSQHSLINSHPPAIATDCFSEIVEIILPLFDSPHFVRTGASGVVARSKV